MRPRRLVLLAVLALVAQAVLAGCGGSASEESAGATESTAQTTTTAPDGTPACVDATAPDPRADGDAEPPAQRLDPEATYELVFATSCGSFTVTLDQEASPATAASLVSLARDGFFDDTVFHRIVPGFAIQGGDPTQSGKGGPGYSTVDTPAQDTVYTQGVVAMGKTASEAPGTSGSQFFVVTAPEAGWLQSEYAVVGTVTNGLDVVLAIGEQGDATTEEPLKPIVVESVTVVEP
jgi:cyclophilin family peptidyl-prolyl cis-trans isomerase